AAALSIDASANQIGRLTSSGTGPLRIYHQYDRSGRMLAQEHVADGTSYVFRSIYGYPQLALGLCAGNACGPAGPMGSDVVGAVFPDGETVSYGFDAGDEQRAVDTRRCADVPLGKK